MFVNYDSDIVVTEVVAALRMFNQSFVTDIHRISRERWALVLKRSGKTVYTVNNKKVVSDSLHPVILPKGASYSWRCIEAGECILIEFEALREYDDILSFEISDNSLLIKSFLAIEKLLDIKSPYYNTKSICALYDCLVFLYKSRDKVYMPKSKLTELAPAIDYISNTYYESNITNEVLASLCSMSTVSFRQSFKCVHGISPIRYLNNLRIQKAKSMLESDYDSITQIAEAVGYESIYHFSKMFRLHTGMSPSEYRQEFITSKR